jgi:hypothetical protein
MSDDKPTHTVEELREVADQIWSNLSGKSIFLCDNYLLGMLKAGVYAGADAKILEESRDYWRKAATEANALRDKAEARVAVLEEALKMAATWFEEYSAQHYAKAKTAPDGGEQHGREVKGKANADRAKVLRTALGEKP